MYSLSARWDDDRMWRVLRRFAEDAVRWPIFRYEDFLRAPQSTLHAMCEAGGVPYDSAWTQAWQHYDTITGDLDDFAGSRIEPQPRRPVPPEFWQQAAGNEDLLATLELLGYPVPAPLRRSPAVATGWESSEAGWSTNEVDAREVDASDWDRSAVYWQDHCRRHPGDREAMLRWAEALCWIGQVHQAAEVLAAHLADVGHWSVDLRGRWLSRYCHAMQQAGRNFETIPWRRLWAADAPGDGANLFQLSILLAGVGEIDEALAYCRHLLRVDERHRGAAANYLLYLNYSDRYSAAEVANEHFRIAMRFHDRAQDWTAAPVASNSQVSNSQVSIPQRIRVGYLAADFYTHPVGKLMLPILQAHDCKRFHVSVYHDGGNWDDVTNRVCQAVDHFAQVHGRSDEAVLRLLREHRLDVLVDLGGYTGGGNRLQVLARRVAPVQASFLGYPNTSAVPAMDYRLTDRYADPPGLTERFYGERLVWLKHAMLAWQPYAEAKAENLAAPRGGRRLRIGLFNNVAKLSPAALAACGEILRRVPEAELVLKYGDRYGLGALRDRYRRLFAAQGVLPHRLRFCTEAQTLGQHLETMAGVDLALDSFPYQGTMTSLECLAVGTPIVSCCGQYYAHRATSAMMLRLGLHELVAEDEREYVEIAVELLHDRGLLEDLREEIQRRFEESPLTDPVGLTRELEELYQRWAPRRRCGAPRACSTLNAPP